MEVEKQQRRPLPGNASIPVIRTESNTLQIQSTCYLKHETCSRDNADISNTLVTITSETRNRRCLLDRPTSEDNRPTVSKPRRLETRVEAGSNTTNVTPASRRMRRKWKSRIWESKMWPRVLRDSVPKMTALARASSNCKRQTHPLVREGAPNQQTRSCQTIIKI
jgi:hypothetical protein